MTITNPTTGTQSKNDKPTYWLLHSHEYPYQTTRPVGSIDFHTYQREVNAIGKVLFCANKTTTFWGFTNKADLDIFNHIYTESDNALT